MARMDTHERPASSTARVVRSLLVSMWVISHTALVHAESGEEAVRLQYTAPAECPDATSFAEQVRERTARGRFAEPSELARTFNVRLVADARGFSGDVDFLDESEPARAR
jgi:hypothetical protein